MCAGISLTSVTADGAPFFFRRIIRGARLVVVGASEVDDMPSVAPLEGGCDALAVLLMIQRHRTCLFDGWVVRRWAGA